MVTTGINQIFLLFTFAFSMGLAIKCFQCNSAEYSECENLTANDTSSPFYKNCTEDYNGQIPFCRKLYNKVSKVENSERILRSCGWILDNDTKRVDHCRKGDTDFLIRESCACFTDACNSSERVHVARVDLTLSVVFSLLFYFICKT